MLITLSCKFKNLVYVCKHKTKRTMTNTKKTYDVVFSNDYNMNSKGFKQDPEFCFDYIIFYNGTDHSYFADYKGGTVSVVCNETGENIMTTTVY